MIVPALYVSKFDPSNQVRDVMKVLWEKLIEQENKSTLFRLHSDAIIRFALSQTSSRFLKWAKCYVSACYPYRNSFKSMA
jgi:hypothetical protein